MLSGRRRAPAVPRSAVVTGGARGIGAAIAAELVARGYAVVVGDIDGDAAARTARSVGAVDGLTHDVRDPDGHRLLARRAVEAAPLGVWFNNAGVGFDGSVADQDPDRVRALVEVNLLGVAWGMQAAVAALRAGPATLPLQERGGSVVNIASLSGLGPVPGLSVYAATKAAVVSLSMSAYAELRAEGIRVHVLNPDGVGTALLKQMQPGGRGSALVHSGGALLTPQDVARAAVDLVGSGRVLRTIPSWRGGMMRASALTPAAAMRLEPLLRRQGVRRSRRWADCRAGRQTVVPPAPPVTLAGVERVGDASHGCSIERPCDPLVSGSGTTAPGVSVGAVRPDSTGR